MSIARRVRRLETARDVAGAIEGLRFAYRAAAG